GNDPDNPGGVVLKNTVENKIMASIDSTGNIVVIDQRITLTQKPNDHVDDPLIIQINFEGKAVGEVYVALTSSALVIGPDDVPFMSPRKPSEGILQGSQVSSGKFNIANLVFDPGFKFTQQELVKRKDFVKVLLKMICIIPRPEAYEPFKSGSGYADNTILADYHPDIKEATLLGFVDGYKGESNEQGLFPFKPENNITRAEAVKIILKALQYRNIVDVSGLKEGDPWFGDYMKAAQDLTPYLKAVKPLQNNFIITAEEAKDPNKLMTFGELIMMAQRVLETYNCFEEDSDSNGLTDYCEAKYDISDPKADQDKDGLNNALECADNLSPLDPDTDGGGVTDGKEIAAHTNPLDPTDDALDDDNDGLSNYDEVNIYHTDPNNPDTDGGGKTDGKEVENCGDPLDKIDDKETLACKNQSVPGLYIVPAECNTCPCISTFLHKAELIPGDIFFSVVGTYYSQYYDTKPNDKTYIFTKGNEVQIQSINK
nr:S-layer homology domain-containing protein [Saprospiraceae bacterium]